MTHVETLKFKTVKHQVLETRIQNCVYANFRTALFYAKLSPFENGTGEYITAKSTNSAYFHGSFIPAEPQMP